MKRWLLTLALVAALVILGATLEQWLVPVARWAEAENETISGLTGIFQFVFWGFAALVAFARFTGWIKGKQPDAKEPSARALRATEGEYLEYLVDRYQYLDLKGMGSFEGVPLRLPLLEMYVSLKARVELPEGETWDRRQLKLAGRKLSPEEQEAVSERLSGPQPVRDLLETHDSLVVLGDPGAGKTTFLKYLTLKLATGEGGELGLDERLPFLLPLSAYATALAEDEVPLDRFIASYAEDRGLDLSLKPVLDRALAKGRALILLDGLDEVREEARRNVVVERVKDFYVRHRGAGNKFVLSSRWVGYPEVRLTAEGLGECMLADFEDEEIEAFVEKWTLALERAARGQGKVTELDAATRRKELMVAIYNHPGVRALASNPLLLTILALMKRQGIDLPERRVELYQKYVEALIKHWNAARSLDGRSGRSLDMLETLRILLPLALWMQERSPGVGLVKEANLRRRVAAIFRQRKHEDPEKGAEQFVTDLQQHAGLLLSRGSGQFGFIHLTFQEYLAALALADRVQEGVEKLYEALADKIGVAEWREVILLTIGCVGVVRQQDRMASALVEKLLDQPPGPPGVAVALVAEAVADLGTVGVTFETRRRVVEDALQVMRNDSEVPARQRAAAGTSLARLGDPRFSERCWHLPDDPLLGFVEVPAGPFSMGSDPAKDTDADDDEQPQHELDLPSFFISRYPVTVAQWRVFVESSGYEPGDRDSLRGVPNHPVMWVSWHDAVAYCDWLGDRLREIAGSRWSKVTDEVSGRFWGGLDQGKLRVTLPSEAEWEKAARGTDGRIFPWGEEASPELANYGETGLGDRSTVGCFPAGASPYGCEEMSGNVWEWTRSSWGENVEEPSFKYPYDPRDGREDPAVGDNVLRVLRGGAFFFSQGALRCAFRNGNSPLNPYWLYGFRVVCAPKPARD